jgi:hypothetical protein
MVTKRLTQYDQDRLQVQYWKNKDGVLNFPISGKVYNEFSSFFITRTLQLDSGKKMIVPTFADKKRQEVEVVVKDREKIDSLFGPVMTYKVQPMMEFRGLYDKDGDTTIWFTDDTCRVPVQINSKILIGSLTARLIQYKNSDCHAFVKIPERKNSGK